MEKVSIIVAVYNVEKYLYYCLDSLINQTYTNLEIILINDGSTDNSKSICEFYKENDKRIVLLSTENKGASHARNLGLSIASGSYVMYVDSDDSIHLKMVEILMGYVNNYNVDLVEFNSMNIVKSQKNVKKFKENIKIISFEKDFFYDRFFRIHGEKNIYLLMNKIIKKDKISNLKLIEGRINEDVLGYFDILLNVDSVLLLEGKMYNYFINKKGVTRRKFSIRDLDLLFMWDQLIINMPDSMKKKYLSFAIQNKKRSYFTLLSKMLFSGYDKDNQEILYVKKTLKQAFNVYFHDILKIKMPMNRKFLAFYIRYLFI